jgi:hypothetical protein
LTAILHDVKLKRIIESVFIAPWTQYLDQVKKNEIVLELKKLSTDHFTEQSTTAAAMRIDDEPAADRQLLMELIKKETKAETKTLQNEIKQLCDTIKTLRGIEKTQGAPETLKKEKTMQKTGRGAQPAAPPRKKKMRPKVQMPDRLGPLLCAVKRNRKTTIPTAQPTHPTAICTETPAAGGETETQGGNSSKEGARKRRKGGNQVHPHENQISLRLSCRPSTHY